MGYELDSGHKWKGVYLVAPLSEFLGKDLRRDALPSACRVRLEKVRDVDLVLPISFPCKGDYMLANGTLQGLRGDTISEPVVLGDTEALPPLAGQQLEEEVLAALER